MNALEFGNKESLLGKINNHLNEKNINITLVIFKKKIVDSVVTKNKSKIRFLNLEDTVKDITTELGLEENWLDTVKETIKEDYTGGRLKILVSYCYKGVEDKE